MSSSVIRYTALIGALALLIVSAPALFVHADARNALRATRPNTPTVVTPILPPALPTPPAPEEPQSGITNTTTGEVNSGGNQGGNVTTGDEHVDVQVTNVGPVNSNVGETVSSGGEVETSPEEPTCSTDRRAANPCSVNAGGRVR